MSAELEAVVIFDENLYRPGHLVDRWMNLLVTHFEGHAQDLAPVRSGQLKAGITGSARRVGEKQMEGLIASNAPHTMYVLGGTTGPIYTDTAWAMGAEIANAYGENEEGRRVALKGHWLPVGNNPWPPIRYRHSVSGQAANNFLVKAWRRTARNHKSLRGFVSEAIHF